MKNQSQSRLASILMFGVGVWLLISPFFISASTAAVISVLIAGAVIAVGAIAQLIWTNTLPSWLIATAAVWLAISALVFNAGASYSWSVVLSAVATFILAVWDGIELRHVQHTQHYGPSH